MGKPKWRKRMGIEPTPRTAAARSNGFEDRESHQAPSASAGKSSTGRDAPAASGEGPQLGRGASLARLLDSAAIRAALLGLLVVAAYGGALRAGVAWDDTFLIAANPAIQTLERPWRFFTDPSTISATGRDVLAQYRPLRTLLFALQFALFGGAAWGFHLVSLCLHLAAGWLVGALTFKLFGRGGWLAAAVWLLHPAVSENVLYLAAQGNLLCLCLGLVTVLAHLRWLENRSPWLRAAALGSLFLAMTAYEFGAVLPALLLIAEVVRGWRAGAPSGSVIRRHAPYWAVLAGFLALRAAVAQAVPREPWWGGSWTAALLHQLGIWLEAWRLTVLPIGQRIRYLPPDIPTWAGPAAAVLAHLAIAALVVRVLVTGKGRILAACIVWWYAAQAPTANIIVTNLGYMFAPRFLFLALVLPVAAAAAWLAGRARTRLVAGALAVAAIAAVGLVRHQVAAWQSPLTLNREIIAANPDDFGGHYTLGWSLLLCGDDREARRELEAARRLAPSWALTHFLLGEIELRAGNMRAAHAAFTKALEEQSNLIEPKLRLAEIALAVGEQKAARAWLATVGSFERFDPFALARVELTLARIELTLGDRAGVPARVERALAAWPHTAPTYFEGGVLLSYCGQRERGRELLRRAAEQVGRDYSNRVGDFAWLDLALLRPLVPLTPPGRFGSVSVPKVGP